MERQISEGQRAEPGGYTQSARKVWLSVEVEIKKN
jgi:hypothetical protein